LENSIAFSGKIHTMEDARADAWREIMKRIAGNSWRDLASTEIRFSTLIHN
jgi:hypothetical protein